MLDNLFTYLDQVEDADDYFVRLDSITMESDRLLAVLLVRDYNDQATSSRWRITSQNVVDFQISEPWGDLLLDENNDVRALQHTDQRQELYFRGKAASPAQTVGLLLDAHSQVTQNRIAFLRYMNGSSLRLLENGFGLLASGPRFLMNAYEGVLRGEGLIGTLLPPSPNKYWTHGQWAEVPTTLATLQVGESYIVAEVFRAVRIED